MSASALVTGIPRIIFDASLIRQREGIYPINLRNTVARRWLPARYPPIMRIPSALVVEWFELWPFEWMVVGSNPISGLSFDFQKQALTLGLKFSDSTPLTHQ